MKNDLFEFWSGVAPEARTHPADDAVFARGIPHSFDLRCLPSPWNGPLRTAPVVLLFLSPGLNAQDLEDAGQPHMQRLHARMRSGTSRAFGPDEHRAAWIWMRQRTRFLGDMPEVHDNVATLNISPYHSHRFGDYHLLSALPSCRAVMAWAQQVLFPAAVKGDRVVVCMRSAKYWGVGRNGRHGAGLFVPTVTRGGHLHKSGTSGAAQDDVAAAVRRALSLPRLPAP